MDFMKGLPDKAYELAITDPNYGIGVTSMRMGSRQTVKPDFKEWDAELPTEGYFNELRRVSTNQVIWGGNYFAGILGAFKSFVVWDKAETMYGRDFAECELAWTSFDKPAQMFKKSPNQLTRIHPTQKPVALYKWLLRNYAKPGDKILDTHGGSGSIAIACYDLGFDLDWMELDKDYYEAAVSRYESHVARYAPASEIPVTKKGEFKLF